jgi:catechol 2,3-dioxygenase-like lactoylglutathione lyase family enzyme
MARLEASISTLRVQDAEASRQFFAQLGFQTVWEYRAADDFPLFLEIRRDADSLFLHKDPITREVFKNGSRSRETSIGDWGESRVGPCAGGWFRSSGAYRVWVCA